MSDNSDAVSRCTGCGTTSTLRDVLQRGTTTDGRSGLLCPACLAKRHAKDCRLALFSLVFPPVAALLLWGVGVPGLDIIVLKIAVGFFLIVVVVTPFHELAHALAALALGLRVYGIQIGWSGKPIWTFHLGRCALVIRRVPVGGLAIVAHRNTCCLRLKQFLVVAAGPASHVLLILPAWMLADQTLQAEWATSLVDTFLVVNIGFLIWNLLPFRYSSSRGKLDSDGLALLKIPFLSQADTDNYHISYYALESIEQRRRENFSAAEDCCLAGLRQYPNNETLLNCLAACLFDLGRYEEVRDQCQRLCDSTEASGEAKALAAANIAWTNLFLRTDGFLVEADEYSRSAYAALPWLPDVQGIRGSVLIEMGDVEAGLELVRSAYEETEDKSNQADYAAYLALGLIHQERIAEARDLLAAAERLNPKCRLLDRVKSQIDQIFLQHG